MSRFLWVMICGILTSQAFAQTGLPAPPLVTTPIPQQSPIYAPPPTGAPVIVEQPLYLDRVAGTNGQEIDSTTFITMDILLGMTTGIRSQVGFEVGPRQSIVAEVFYGGLFTKIGTTEAVGGGVRYQWRRVSTDQVNQLALSPGLAFYSAISGDERNILAPTMEVTWIRAFSPGNNWGWQIGLSAGIGVDAGGSDRGTTGEITPLISVFSGFRF